VRIACWVKKTDNREKEGGDLFLRPPRSHFLRQEGKVRDLVQAFWGIKKGGRRGELSKYKGLIGSQGEQTFLYGKGKDKEKKKKG